MIFSARLRNSNKRKEDIETIKCRGSVSIPPGEGGYLSTFCGTGTYNFSSLQVIVGIIFTIFRRFTELWVSLFRRSFIISEVMAQILKFARIDRIMGTNVSGKMACPRQIKD